jgi:hypothetical protein
MVGSRSGTTAAAPPNPSALAASLKFFQSDQE